MEPRQIVQIANGLQHLHENKVVHASIKGVSAWIRTLSMEVTVSHTLSL